MPSLPRGRKSKTPRSRTHYKKDGSIDWRARKPFHDWNPEYAHLYQTAGWKKLRLVVLQSAPTCPVCMHNNVVTPAKEVDHVLAHRGERELFYDLDNLWALCTPCHRLKTAAESNGALFKTKKEWLDHLVYLSKC